MLTSNRALKAITAAQSVTVKSRARDEFKFKNCALKKRYDMFYGSDIKRSLALATDCDMPYFSRDCCSRLGGVPWELRQALIESFKPGLQVPSALEDKAYRACGEAASALHAMVLLQVYQAKALMELHKGSFNPGVMQELCTAVDLALRATKVTARSLGRVMCTLVV
ncbi:hypothetical protein PO909_030476 [Leuciscus waleckii]